jgi:hypothetical protein
VEQGKSLISQLHKNPNRDSITIEAALSQGSSISSAPFKPSTNKSLDERVKISAHNICAASQEFLRKNPCCALRQIAATAK